ncbi:sporulation protein [Pandoraea captiosa]|uniref:Sporulation protein n=1 Tax=Pandoraea captiosa TaxID=2508302 RepID=A0A5E5A8N1_9BURK|nr:SPOR domain-containing protein [Pandoraea captiosa]VVE68460.1 sporulation protein [Pandoraea captiosa]
MRVTHQMRDDQSNDASFDLSQGPMGLFSFRKKDAEAVSPKRGSRRSGRTGTRTAGGGGEYSEHEQLDPLLPEKQRARRRLVGALALVLAAVIILPMVLAPEPKPAADDIAIQIPGKDANSPPVRVKPQAAAVPPSDASLDKGEEAIDSSTLAQSAKPAPSAVPPSAAAGSTSTPTPGPVATVPEPQVAQVKPEHKPDAKPEVKKPEPHADTKVAAKPESHDAAKTQPKPNNNVADPIAQFAQNNTTAKPAAKPADNHDNAQKTASSGKYLVRIGAFSTQDRAQAWLVKLKLVNVPSYMVKSTVDGRELYLLRAGPFPDRNAAEAAGKKIRDAGLTAQVAEAG